MENIDCTSSNLLTSCRNVRRDLFTGGKFRQDLHLALKVENMSLIQHGAVGGSGQRERVVGELVDGELCISTNF